MFDPKRYILAGGTVVVALGIGFVMQQSPDTGLRSVQTVAPEAQTASLSTRIDADVISDQADVTTGVTGMNLSGIAHTSAAPQLSVEQSTHSDDVEIAAAVPGVDDVVTITDQSDMSKPQAEMCETAVQAVPAPAAMVDLTITANCLPDARVTVHHNGMMVSLLTDASGVAKVRAPALSKEALFIASFENGQGAVARAEVPDLEAYDRVVLQWRGDAGFQVHALEYGADYGEPGHIWHDAPGDIDRAVAGTGGFVTDLGDTQITDGLRAEVYTFPTGIAQAGEVMLSAEAVVTPHNCTRDIEAQAIQVSAGGALKVQDLTLTMPSCEVAGDILMLKNLLQDLKIARN